MMKYCEIFCIFIVLTGLMWINYPQTAEALTVAPIHICSVPNINISVMKYKKCSNCGDTKPFDLFYKSKKDGFQSWCIDCKKQYKRSKEGHIKSIYNNNKSRSLKLFNEEIKYTFEELSDFFYNNNYDKLYNEWVNSDFLKTKSPSIDRIDDYKNYSLDNIRLVTWGDNITRYRYDVKEGINNKQNYLVAQLSINNVLLNTYHSVNEAMRRTKINKGNILKVCNGDRLSAGGYKWNIIKKKY